MQSIVDYVTDKSNPFVGNTDAAKQLALPSLEPYEEPRCVLSAVGFSCTREEFFAGIDTRQPARRPNTSPGYSSTAYVILGYALQSITGHSFKESLQSLADALKLDATSVDTPDLSRAAILKDLPNSAFTWNAGDVAPTGGVYSSMNDISQIGRSMLRSTFLDANTTRAWLKPTAFTSDLRSALGRPWEIYRVDTKSSRGVIDLFAKGGDWGLYHTKFVLVPDYNVGFTAFVGGSGEKDWFNDQIIDIVFPALEEVAREQANEAYAGTYTSTLNNSTTTITFSTEAGKPGLGIEDWLHNGTNLLDALSEFSGQRLTTDNFRLLPAGLDRKLEDGSTEISWKALIRDSKPHEEKSVFAACDAWFTEELTPYGHHTLDQVLFTLGPDGKATKVALRAWKTVLQRKG
jgi:hypothetical protein